MGYQPVYEETLKELEKSERAYSSSESLVKFIMEKQGNSSGHNDSFIAARERCLERENDMSCHNFFKRCYISFRPQSLCREACEDLIFNVCKLEARIFAEFLERMRHSGFRYPFKVMNCTAMKFRNESPNCYYPDKMRG